MSSATPLRLAAAMVLAAVAGGCTVGPNYVRPTAAVPAAFKESPPWQPAQLHAPARRGAWWEIFGEPELNGLEAQVAPENQGVAAAAARFAEAQALARAARSGYFPQVGATASVTQSYSGKTGGGRATTSHVLSADVAWELDLWGRVRRGVEASEAGALASAADLEAVTLSMQAELALDYFQLRTLDAQIALSVRTIGAYQRSLALSRTLYAAGMTSQADVLLAETQIHTTQAQAIDLGVQRAQLEHAIAALVGKPPASFAIAPAPLDHAPPDIPHSQPAELLERRPDIAAAERRVAAANAQIGVARAAFFPAVNLGATAGFAASTLPALLSWPSRVWSLGTSLTQTIFDGGLRTAQVDLAKSTYDATVADYRQTVLTGFTEVEDNLAALRILEEEAAAQADARTTAEKSLAMITSDYRSGLVSYFNVITAQTTALNTARVGLDIAGRRMTGSVQLVRAMGGVWRNDAGIR